MRIWTKIKTFLYAGITLLAAMLVNMTSGCPGVLASESAEGTMDAQTAWILVGIIALVIVVAVIVAAVTSVISGVVGSEGDTEE